MKKTIEVLSIIAISIAIFHLVWAILSLTLLWKPLCGLYSSSPEVVAIGPTLPADIMVQIIGVLACAIAVFLFAKFTSSIAGEVLVLSFLSVVLPPLENVLSLVQTQLVGNMENYALIALSASRWAVNLPSLFTALALIFVFVVCGMSIAEKVILKKLGIKRNR